MYGGIPATHALGSAWGTVAADGTRAAAAAASNDRWLEDGVICVYRNELAGLQWKRGWGWICMWMASGSKPSVTLLPP